MLLNLLGTDITLSCWRCCQISASQPSWTKLN